jgi:hypothetical protein
MGSFNFNYSWKWERCLNTHHGAPSALICIIGSRLGSAMMLHLNAVSFVFCYMLGLAAAHLYSYIWPVNEASMQRVTKRCRLSWLTNSALYEPKCGGWDWGVSANEYSCAQIFFGDLTPYLTYASMYFHCEAPYVNSEGYVLVLYIRLQNKHKFLISAYNFFRTLKKLATPQRTENIFICYWFNISRYRSFVRARK